MLARRSIEEWASLHRAVYELNGTPVWAAIVEQLTDDRSIEEATLRDRKAPNDAMRAAQGAVEAYNRAIMVLELIAGRARRELDRSEKED